jgi:hypothetical protein
MKGAKFTQRLYHIPEQIFQSAFGDGGVKVTELAKIRGKSDRPASLGDEG